MDDGVEVGEEVGGSGGEGAIDECEGAGELEGGRV